MPHKYNEKMFDIKHLRETAEKLKNWGRWGPDDEIGTLDERWNWLEGWTSSHNKDKPYAVHYTRGGPWFSEWQDVEFAKEWLAERDEYLFNKFKS
mgnify:CR=1 FL=1